MEAQSPHAKTSGARPLLLCFLAIAVLDLSCCVLLVSACLEPEAPVIQQPSRSGCRFRGMAGHARSVHFLFSTLSTAVQGHDYPPEANVRKELIDTVRRVIGPIATPDCIHWAPGLPKTRSGKIMSESPSPAKHCFVLPSTWTEVPLIHLSTIPILQVVCQV